MIEKKANLSKFMKIKCFAKIFNNITYLFHFPLLLHIWYFEWMILKLFWDKFVDIPSSKISMNTILHFNLTPQSGVKPSKIWNVGYHKPLSKLEEVIALSHISERQLWSAHKCIYSKLRSKNDECDIHMRVYLLIFSASSATSLSMRINLSIELKTIKQFWCIRRHFLSFYILLALYSPTELKSRSQTYAKLDSHRYSMVRRDLIPTG